MRHRIAAALLACAVLAAPAVAEGYPDRQQMDSVREFLKERRGVVGVGVVDDTGHIRGIHTKRRFVTASVIKAMLLVAYLRKVDYHGRKQLTSYERSRLGPMIRVSSNGAATWTYHRVGDVLLRRLAKRADMDQFRICCSWAYARFSAQDQAKFFWQIRQLLPDRFRSYGMWLLRSIVPSQSWGIPSVARPRGFSVFFKGGWRGTGRGQLVHQASFIRYRGREFSLAVLTDGNPSMSYGIQTIAGVTKRLLRRKPRPASTSALGTTPQLRRAGLWNLQSLDPDIRVRLNYTTKRNATKRPLPGYCEPWAMLKRRPAKALALVQRDLEKEGLGLLIGDAYRPHRATRALVRWAYRTGRGHLVGTYIATRSNHNRGFAVDLTLVRLRSGKELDLGGFGYGRNAHTYNARGRRLENRMTLLRAMKRRGFANYPNEWWHYEHRHRPMRLLDVPLGC